MSVHVKLVNVLAEHALMQAVVNDSMTWCAMNYVSVVSAHEHGVRSKARRIHCCCCWWLVCFYVEYTEWAVSLCLPHVYGCDMCCSALGKTESRLLAFYFHLWLPAWFYTFTTSCVHTISAPKICCIARNMKKVWEINICRSRCMSCYWILLTPWEESLKS